MIRGDGTPYFLEVQTYRFRAHSMYDAELYRTKAEVEKWKERDPISTFTTRLKEWELIGDDELAAMDEKVAAEIAEAIAFAEAGPWEPVEDLLKDVYTPR